MLLVRFVSLPIANEGGIIDHYHWYPFFLLDLNNQSFSFIRFSSQRLSTKKNNFLGMPIESSTAIDSLTLTHVGGKLIFDHIEHPGVEGGGVLF